MSPFTLEQLPNGLEAFFVLSVRRLSSMLSVCEQRSLWRDCAYEPSLLVYAISSKISCSGSFFYQTDRGHWACRLHFKIMSQYLSNVVCPYTKPTEASRPACYTFCKCRHLAPSNNHCLAVIDQFGLKLVYPQILPLPSSYVD